MLKPGDRFGDYTVERLLGQGGMGSVYLLQTEEGSQVASKILDPATAGDRESRKRFLREAQLALGVRHPNLVETYDVGEDPDTGLCYILMEYVPGGSLADRLDSGPIPIAEAIRIVYQIASVLELAREKGIVHRDIKPANIMFGADGQAKLADLGIARSGASLNATTVTLTGMMIGTPAYMAPEQMLDAHNVDTRADIYSLGIVFYEMLAGQRPNPTDTVVQLMAKAVAGEPIPDVRKMRPEVSAAVAELVSLMCAMKADERVATPAEVMTALSQVAHGREVTIRRKVPKSGARKRKLPLRRFLPLGLAVVGVAGFAAFYHFGRTASSVRSPPPHSQAKQVRQPEAEPSGNQRLGSASVEDRAKAAEPIEGRVKAAETSVVRTKGVVPDRKATPVRTPAGVTDRRVRFAEVDGSSWFYTLEGGEAVVWRGENGYNGETKPAVRPEPEGEVRIPDSLDGHKVAVIGNLAFFRCRKVTSVEIPEGVREIRGWAFLDCDRLANVRIPASMKSMKRDAFCSCRALKTIDIGRCPDVLGSTFWNCPSLAEVRVSPENPSYVAKDGLVLSRDGSTLIFFPRPQAAVTWPEGLKRIGAGAFLGSRVGEVDVPDSVEQIGAEAFFSCAQLRRIGFGEGLREVGKRAFEFCRQLSELDFPQSLVRLEGSLAERCPELKRIVFRGDAPRVDADRDLVLGKVPEELEILVKPGSKGWNGPASTDLPTTWPPGNFEDSRPIRRIGSKPGDSAFMDASAIVVEAPAGCETQRRLLESMLAKIVPALKRLMGATLRFQEGDRPRKIVFSEKTRGWRVSKDGAVLTLSPVMGGFPVKTAGVGERVAVFLSGLGRRGSVHSEVCADAMDWYLSFRLREMLGSDFDGKTKFTDDLAGLDRDARKLDPKMTLYDLGGNSRERKARKLSGTQKAKFAKGKCWWLFEELRKRNDDVIGGYLQAFDRELAAGNLSDPVSQDDVAALFSAAIGEDLFGWFAEHGIPVSSERTRVKVKFTGASTPDGWLDDFEQAKKRAGASGKLILAAFEGSDWCGWCKKMEKDVYTQPDFMPRVTPRFVPVYIDQPRNLDLLSEKCRRRNPELHREYAIRGVPCVVILDAEGKELGRVGGYKKDVGALMERVDVIVGRTGKPLANAGEGDGPKRKADGKTSTPSGMTDDFDVACERARKEKKDVLIVFSGSDWCGYCKRLDDDVLSERKFARQVSRRYVAVYVDSPHDRSLLSPKAQEKNPELVNRYAPNGYPTVVVTNADGEELARFSGYGGGGVSAFMRRLEDTVREARQNRRKDGRNR